MTHTVGELLLIGTATALSTGVPAVSVVAAIGETRSAHVSATVAYLATGFPLVWRSKVVPSGRLPSWRIETANGSFYCPLNDVFQNTGTMMMPG